MYAQRRGLYGNAFLKKMFFIIALLSISKAMFCHFYFSLMMRPILIFLLTVPIHLHRLAALFVRPRSAWDGILQSGIACRTIQHRRLDLLTITDKGTNNKKKKMVFITARVHPGDTGAIHMPRSYRFVSQ